MSVDNPAEPRWWERLAKTETAVENITKDIAQLMHAVEMLSRTVAGVGRTDWGVLIGGGMLILSIVAMVGGALGTGFLRDMNRVERDVRDHDKWATQKAMELEFERGKAQQQREDLRSAVVKLDTDLQREMRDVNATTEEKIRTVEATSEARIDAVDRRMQNEITNVVSLMQDRLHMLEDYQLRARELNAAQGERARAIERAVFGGRSE